MGNEPLTFRRLQDEQRPWVAHNFPGRDQYYALLGAVEEIGEVCHAHLKWKQGIRGCEQQHMEAMADGVADCVIFLADYCTAMGFDFQDIMERTWASVKTRDWKTFPIDGVSK